MKVSIAAGDSSATRPWSLPTEEKNCSMARRRLPAKSARSWRKRWSTTPAGLLPGHPQFVLFTCQLAALRILWGVLDGAERRHVLPAVGGLALAMVVMLLLTAVQYLPSLEVIGESVRRTTLRPDEIEPSGLQRSDED